MPRINWTTRGTTVYQGTHVVAVAASEEEARLIAAAPRLLETVKLLYRYSALDDGQEKSRKREVEMRRSVFHALQCCIGTMAALDFAKEFEVEVQP